MEHEYGLLFTLLPGFIFYVPIGVMLHLRKNHKPIRSRSPVLILTSHWSNFLSMILMTLDLFLLHDEEWNYMVRGLFKVSIIFFHYMVYTPYILRGYRLSYIFNLDKTWDEQDNNFKKNIHRISQTWLIKHLILWLLPVFVILFAISAIPEIGEFVPDTGHQDVVTSRISNSIYIFFCFLEELVFIICIYMLRNVNDDYNINKELIIVCFLWFFTSLFSAFSNDVWLIVSICRNFVLMLVSAAWPLYRSYTYGTFQENLTYEMLQTLELVLQHPVSLENFEKFIVRSSSISCESSNMKLKGPEMLNFWLMCENLKYDWSSLKAMELYESYCIYPSPIGIPIEISESIKNIIESGGSSEYMFRCAQEFILRALNEAYFSRFTKSHEYQELIRYVAQSNIYRSRLDLTSLSSNI